MMIKDIVRKLLAERPEAPSAVIHAVIIDYCELLDVPLIEDSRKDIPNMVTLIDEMVAEAAGRNTGQEKPMCLGTLWIKQHQHVCMEDEGHDGLCKCSTCNRKFSPERNLRQDIEVA